MGIYKLEQENIKIETALPIQALSMLRLEEALNAHSVLEIKAMAWESKEKEVLEQSWQGTSLLITFGSEPEEPLFYGKLETLKVVKEKGGLLLHFTAISRTKELDRKKKSRSFQNPQLTYKQVVEQILGYYSPVTFRWNGNEEKNIGQPIIQYEETDWAFLRRLSSHFGSCLLGESDSKTVCFSFGPKKGQERIMEEGELTGWGIHPCYYENGCYEKGLSKGYACYLEVKTQRNWKRGDYVIYEGIPYLLYEKRASFHGELTFTYRLGTPGLYVQKKYHNPGLAGIRLLGMVRKVKGEAVYIQLDIDEKEDANYPWKWAPETNNISYCMPEIDTIVELYFSTGQEISGQAVSGRFPKEQSSYCVPQNREFVTIDKKKLGLYPQKLFLEGKAKAERISLEDTAGILVNTKKKISFQAEGRIQLEGRNITVVSPIEVVCKTPVSNIELCRDINLFAPGGVQTIGTKEEFVKSELEKGKTEQAQVDSWQAAYTALAAIPTVDFGQDKGGEDAVGIAAMASIPQLAGGQAIVSMAQVMEGTKERDCAFPRVFRSMDNYTVKGGYLLPKETDCE